jgi:hypothetical protein
MSNYQFWNFEWKCTEKDNFHKFSKGKVFLLLYYTENNLSSKFGPCYAYAQVITIVCIVQWTNTVCDHTLIKKKI